MAYVPPHKRGKSSSELEASQTEGLPTRRIEESTFYSKQEICERLGTQKLHTLTESPATPGSLALIAIHDGQHPGWPPTILCKTNLHLLPDQESPDFALHGREYPVFVETPFHSRTGRQVMEFDGWWKLIRIEYLESQSEGLITMLERKFSRPGRKGRFGSNSRAQGKTRTAEAWAESLSLRWAVITLERNKTRNDNPLNDFAEATGKYLQSLKTNVDGEDSEEVPKSTSTKDEF